MADIYLLAGLTASQHAAVSLLAVCDFAVTGGTCGSMVSANSLCTIAMPTCGILFCRQGQQERNI